MSEHEGRFFGSREELQNDVLRYQSRMSVGMILSAMQSNQTMKWDGGKITWHLVEKYEDVWDVSGYEFSQVMLDLSLALLDREGLPSTIQYIQSRIRRPWRHK